MREKITVDPSIIWGWDKVYNNLNVEVLEIARNLGYTFPRVNVVHNEKGFYELVYGRKLFFDNAKAGDNYGGHSRSISALRTGCGVDCNVVDYHRESLYGLCYPLCYPETDEPVRFKPISKISGEVLWDYHNRRKVAHSLFFLPREIAQEFLEKNGLFVSDGIIHRG